MIGFKIDVKELEDKINNKNIKLKQLINQKGLAEDNFAREQINKQLEMLKKELRVLEKEMAKRVQDHIIQMYKIHI